MIDISAKLFILVLMILGHLLADYPLQGWLAQSKVKSYWENGPIKNKYDYIPALICHAIMWGIVVMLPIMLISYNMSTWSIITWIMLFINIILHIIIDHLKANMKIINLWQDQLFHMAQILVTWIVWAFII